MKIEILESPGSLDPLKELYIRETTAPLDGMWLFGFLPMADHYGFFDGEICVGFACVNQEHKLLQFFLRRSHQHHAGELFASLLRGDGGGRAPVQGAFVSTAEPHYLSLCLDHFGTFKVNARMYQREAPSPALAPQGLLEGSPERWQLVAIEASELAEVVAFAVESTGAPEAWLAGYYTNLIGRGELFGVREGEPLVALGESRGNDRVQVECVDLGVIVCPSARGRGLATHVLRRLAAANDARGLRSICSTESGNIAAQRAITRAGFFAYNRIVEFGV
jgi:GNAT superfamily N-acetyltransferase